MVGVTTSRAINNEPLQTERLDFDVMELHRQRIRDTVTDPAKVDALMPYYQYRCRRPLFHDEYLPSLNRENVHIVDCPAGIDRVTEHGVVVEGHEYEVDCIVYATGFEPEVTPFPRVVRATRSSAVVDVPSPTSGKREPRPCSG